MSAIPLHQGMNPTIDPAQVEKIYHYCRRSAERWAPFNRFTYMTLHDHIIPTVVETDNPLPAFAKALENRVLEEYKSVREFYEKNRSGRMKRLKCWLFHKDSHVHGTYHIIGQEFYFRDCCRCSVIDEFKTKQK